MIQFLFDVELPPSADELIAMCGLEPGGRVQCAIDNAVATYMRDYWAYDTGRLANSVSGIGTGELVWDQPYAKRMYYGVGINYNTSKNSLAGAYPFERMKADHFEDILEEARSVAGCD